MMIKWRRSILSIRSWSRQAPPPKQESTTCYSEEYQTISSFKGGDCDYSSDRTNLISSLIKKEDMASESTPSKVVSLQKAAQKSAEPSANA
ncbi:hypothetical protein Q3G72_028660 [Acer saccharum]|nr:hypothetical protein Q3G72_028660 [Acer saccharum]